jgi:hypothetical protein
MRNGILCLMVLSGALFASSAVLADTVVIHRDDAGVAVPAPPPPDAEHKVVVEHHSSDGCDSKTVHKENGMGDAKTVKKTNCD